MRKYLLYILVAVLMYGCNEDDYFRDSGKANAKFDGSILEYLESDTKNNWDSAVVIIRHAGLEDLFRGKDPDYPQITFFGFTNYSVAQYLFNTLDGEGNQLYNRIADMPVDLCRKMVLCHVIAGKNMMQDFDYEIKGTHDGGTWKENLAGTKLRIYRIQNSFNGIPDMGVEKLAFESETTQLSAIVASCNIEPNNGVVHSLRTTYQWSEL